MRQIQYNENTKERARELRKQGIIGEVLLWEQLRCKQMRGYQFNRQKPLGKYIVDFYCRKLGLVIEIDGTSHQHDEAWLTDQTREEALVAMGLQLLRFSEKEVRYQMTDVLESISHWIEEKETGSA